MLMLMLMSKCEPALSDVNKLSIIAQVRVSNPVLMLSITKIYTDVAQIVLFFFFNSSKPRRNENSGNVTALKLNDCSRAVSCPG